MVCVKVASLSGSTTVYDCQNLDRIVDIKRKIAGDRALPSSRIKLLHGSEIQKNDVVLETLATDGLVELQSLADYERVSAGAVNVVSSDDWRDTWEAAANQVVHDLGNANVEQGQVLWIDLHNKNLYANPIVCAYFSTDILGRGPLQVDYRMRRATAWEELYEWADEFSVGKDVISISGASTLDGMLLCIFWYTEEICPTATVEHICSSESSWNWAADGIILKLHDRGVQRGQLLGIDAHNISPNGPALFTAHFSCALQGYGRLDLDWRCFVNDNFVWSTIHNYLADGNAGKEVVSLTSSSNCSDQKVGYSFWHVPVDPLEFCVVESPAGTWKAACDALAAKLNELQIQASQVVTIDAHNRGFNQSCVLSAHYHKVASRTHDRPLQLAMELRENRDGNYQRLREWASAVSIGKEVLSVTATSGTLEDNTSGLSMMVFYQGLVQEPLPDTMPVEFVRSSSGTWNDAASSLLHELQRAKVERGHIISISACNLHPDAPAEFQCHFCRARASSQKEGRFSYANFNIDASFNAMHHQIGVKSSGKDIISITGSSNEDGRCVLYVFYWDERQAT